MKRPISPKEQQAARARAARRLRRQRRPSLRARYKPCECLNCHKAKPAHRFTAPTPQRLIIPWGYFTRPRSLDIWERPARPIKQP